MARQIKFQVSQLGRWVDLVPEPIGEPHLFLSDAMQWVINQIKAHGEAGGAFWDGNVETDNPVHMECVSQRLRFAIDEVPA